MENIIFDFGNGAAKSIDFPLPVILTNELISNKLTIKNCSFKNLVQQNNLELFIFRKTSLISIINTKFISLSVHRIFLNIDILKVVEPKAIDARSLGGSENSFMTINECEFYNIKIIEGIFFGLEL